MNRFLAPLILLLITALIYLAWVALTPAMAHDWYVGQRNVYGQSCCYGEGANVDCAHAPAGSIREVQGGYIVTLTKEQMLAIRPNLKDTYTFKRVTWGISEVVHVKEAQPALDGNYSVCLRNYPQQTGGKGPLRWIVCFFYPTNS